MVRRDTNPASQCVEAATAVPFATAVAASQLSGKAPINSEGRVGRAARAAAETPVVKLPGRHTCLDCPFSAGRYAANLVPADTSFFREYVVGVRDDLDLMDAAAEPPMILAGIDLADGPHVRVTPGFEDYARVIDPTVLADALYFNQVLPACACTRALFDAADKETFSGLRLDFLRQEAALKANCPKAVPASAS